MIKFRRGDTFKRIIKLQDPSEQPIIPEAVFAQLRTKDYVMEFEVAATAEPGEYELKIQDTSNLLLGLYQLHVRFEFLGENSSMPPVDILVEEGYRNVR